MEKNKYISQHTYTEQKKLDDERANFMVKCKHCGHTMTMIDADRTICAWCGYWVYRTPELEFAYKIKEQLIKANKGE